MGKIKISIRRKPLEGKFNSTFLDAHPLQSKKIKISKHFGILTACSSRLFIGLQMLLTSIAHYYHVTTLVYDVGLTAEQVAWCHRQPGVTVKLFTLPEVPKHIKYSAAWFKSHYVKSSPFKHTIWIDADAIVVGDLRELIEWSHPQALFTSDHTPLQASTINHPSLYSYLQVGKSYYADVLPYLNTGVFVVNNKRDEKLIDDWCYCVEKACETKEIAYAISCWDQGACKWALHKNDKLFLISADKKFNYPAKVRHYSYPATPETVDYWMRNAKPPDACIVLHWMGSPKPWNHWGETLNLDLSKVQ
jgi:hypothetical protein